jgi:uncharacterized protein with GYD domain
MSVYISLVNYTPQGIAKIKDSPARMDAARKAATALGGKILEVYLTMGRYDGVVLSDFPDDAAYAKFMLSVASSGFMSTETLKALTETEFRHIIGSLG